MFLGSAIYPLQIQNTLPAIFLKLLDLKVAALKKYGRHVAKVNIEELKFGVEAEHQKGAIEITKLETRKY